MAKDGIVRDYYTVSVPGEDWGIVFDAPALAQYQGQRGREKKPLVLHTPSQRVKWISHVHPPFFPGVFSNDPSRA